MSEKIENFRLPKYAIPTRYNIELSPDLEEKKFQGKVDLSINILEETDQISVNVAELHVNSIQINSDNLKNLKVLNWEIDDQYENGRGTTLSDILYRGRLDIITSNWNGYHRAFVLEDNKFKDIATPTYNIPTRIRTVISADFDNDGYDEIFMNNIGEPNKLFKIKLPSGLYAAIEAKLRAEQEAQQMQFVLDREKKEAERKQIEAEGIKKAHQILKEEILIKKITQII